MTTTRTGAGLIIAVLLVGAVGLLAGFRPATAARAVQQPIVLQRHSTAVTGTWPDGQSFSLAIYPSISGTNTVHVTAPPDYLHVTLVAAMGGMAGSPTSARLARWGGGDRGRLALPMFGDYLIRVGARWGETGRGDRQGVAHGPRTLIGSSSRLNPGIGRPPSPPASVGDDGGRLHKERIEIIKIALEGLLHDIDEFLSHERRSSSGPATAGSEGPDWMYWHTKAETTAADIDTLTMLENGPTSIEGIASILGRDHESTRELLEALVAVGVVELRSNGYTTSPAAHLYLQMLSQRRSEE